MSMLLGGHFWLEKLCPLFVLQKNVIMNSSLIIRIERNKFLEDVHQRARGGVR